MIGSNTSFESRVSTRRAIGNAIRRRVWRWLFAPHQRELGSFFLDPRDHIGAERIVTGDWYEGQLLSVLEAVIGRLGLGSGTALDVGANIGNHSCFFAPLFRRLICIEPGAEASLILEANLRAAGHRNAELQRVALGDRERSGVLQKIDPGNLGSSVVQSVEGDGEFRILRGDDLVRALAVTDLRFVKVDVEGGEVSVLEGLRETLARQQPVVCIEVLEESRWALARGILEAAGYASWFVIVPERDGRGAWGRVRAMLGGRRLRLAPLPDGFRPGGYDMILCMTGARAANLTHSDGSRAASDHGVGGHRGAHA